MTPIENGSHFQETPRDLQTGIEVLNFLDYLQRQGKISYEYWKMRIDSGGRLDLDKLVKLCPDFSVLRKKTRKIADNPLAGMGFKFCDIFTSYGLTDEHHQGLPVIRQGNISLISMKIGDVWNVNFDGSLFKVEPPRADMMRENERFPYPWSFLDVGGGKMVSGYKETLGEVSYADEKLGKLAIIGACMIPGSKLDLRKWKALGFYFKKGNEVIPFILKDWDGKDKLHAFKKATKNDLEAIGGDGGTEEALTRMYGIEI